MLKIGEKCNKLPSDDYDISKEEALKEIKEYAGTQFGPELAEIFVEIMMNEH
ncbi:hypothetical protein [Halarsenatibacter silvermanii]|uniref:hypothetical protein n=1 Tax=Halarsenatibacter silvermanii TaxID=321763 RepID=UPI00135630E5|nr:hypothetical protein [Halarsenatibacter silvermanii]